MGMYTGVAVRCRLNDLGQLVFDQLVNHKKEWKDIAEDFPVVADYAASPRAWGIPFCSSAYFSAKDFAAVGFECDAKDPRFGHLLNLDGHNLTFACSLKNYDNEVRAFVDLLKHLVAEPCTVFSRYEEFDDWDMDAVSPVPVSA